MEKPHLDPEWEEITMLQLSWLVFNKKQPKIKYVSKVKDYISYDGYGYLRVERLETAYNHDCKVYLWIKDKDRLPKEFFDLNNK